jgi:hypothetical protein
MITSRDTLIALLNELADWLKFENTGPVEWVVCGGVALALQGLNDRSTKDVDVLGGWEAGAMEVTLLERFPAPILSCIQRVAENHPELSGLRKDWVNLGPRALAKHGLPKGYATRTKALKFGEMLTLRLLDRVDLIALKLHAASARFSHRQEIHFDDLRRLNGSFAELDAALDWVRALSDFEEKRPEIQNVLQRLGHDDLAYYV